MRVRRTIDVRRWTVVVFAVLLAVSLAVGGTDDPDYPHGDFEDDCSMCHRPDGWTPVEVGPEFDHSKSGFKLDASHERADCRACHVSLDFSQVSTVCASCHADVHQGELGADCARCHTARSFIDRFEMVRAHVTTRFPLRGAHRIADCEDCHEPVAQGGYQFVNTPVECVACHRAEYQATTDPDHQASGFPLTCEACHSTVAWVPAGFNHTLAAGTPCATCHLDDYLATADPNHPTAGFSQQCESCHNTREWIPASFDGLNHDAAFFPIFSGRHRGRWSSCSDCHVVPNTYATFECIQCHEHDDPTDLAGKHGEVPGYTYDSQACYGCHPRGEAEE